MQRSHFFKLVIIKNLGVTDYSQTLKKMQEFVKNSNAKTNNKNTSNEIWITSHNAIFTHGVSSSDSHIIKKNNIPVIRTDRGGQITYHGIGQIVIYTLLDLKSLGFGVKKLVEKIEESIILTLKDYKITAARKINTPGVFVGDAKIAALGLKIKNSKTYHGLSLNVNMDLTPFSLINPCGYADLKVCQMQDFLNEKISVPKIEKQLCKHLKAQLVKL